MRDRGRTGIYEPPKISDTVREMVLSHAMTQEMRKYARTELGMLTLREEALIKAAQGVTSAEEVLTHTELFID